MKTKNCFRARVHCNEWYDTRTLSSRNQRTSVMQKIIKLYTQSHNYSNTEVRRTTNSLNPTMVFDNMHKHSSHLSFYKQRKNKLKVSNEIKRETSTLHRKIWLAGGLITSMHNLVGLSRQHVIAKSCWGSSFPL